MFSLELSVLHILNPHVGNTLPDDVFLIAGFMGPTWGQSGADRTQVGPMNFAIWGPIISNYRAQYKTTHNSFDCLWRLWLFMFIAFIVLNTISATR